jgi:hypothetical protein
MMPMPPAHRRVAARHASSERAADAMRALMFSSADAAIAMLRKDAAVLLSTRRVTDARSAGAAAALMPPRAFSPDARRQNTTARVMLFLADAFITPPSHYAPAGFLITSSDFSMLYHAFRH